MTSVSPASSSTADSVGGRSVPWNNEAEQSVLGAMVLDQDAALRAVELIDDTVFYREAHRRIFRAIRRLLDQRMVIDPVTLRNELDRSGELADIGGGSYLADLSDMVPGAANLEYHIQIVKEKSILRNLIEAATSILQETYEGRKPANDLLDQAETRIFHVAQDRQGENVVRIKELLWPTMERIELLQKAGKRITGVPSGFTDLDELTSGFQPSELIVVAARPSMGKTALCLNMAAHAAIEHRAGVLLFSLEMSNDSLVQRFLCSEGMVDAMRMRRGMLSDADFTRLARAAGVLSGAPLFFFDQPSLTALQARSVARRQMREQPIGLIIVDYLQLMRSPDTASQGRVQEISDISRSLKALARELEVPVVALSQLSRASEQRGGDRKPILSDLRDSGAIEQDADIVMFIHRPEYYEGNTDKEGNSLEGKAEVMVAKNRNGPTGHVDLFFHKQYTRFDNYSERQDGDGHGA
ncbi:MAG: replicative DNA helicase [Gemmatimonadales bacterium]